MFDSGYYITAELRVIDSTRLTETRSALIELCEKSLTEKGCTLFLLHHDEKYPTRFLLWERFDDEAAFKAHFDEAHTKAYVALALTEVVQFFQSNVVKNV